MNVEDCVLDGTLVKATPNKKIALRSLELAKHKLGIAVKEFDAKIYENAIISAYTSMFHAARTLLFKDGYKERSHYALCLYIKEKYGGKIEQKYVNELNILRMQRHGLMYGLEERVEVQEVEAESAISIARGFLKTVRGLLKD